MSSIRLLALGALLAPAALLAQEQRPPARPLSLTDAIAMAERTSETVNIAGAGVLRARGQQLAARSAYFPQLGGVLNYQRTLQSQFQQIGKRFAGSGGGADSSGGGGDLASSPLARIFAAKNTVVLGLTGSQALYSGGRVTAQNRAADAGARAAQIGLTAAQAQVRLDVASAYYDASLADRMVAIAESSLVQAERTFRQASIARQVGNVAEFELLRARVARDNLRPQVIQARSQRDVAYLRLRQLVHAPLDQQLELTSDIQEGLPGRPDGVRLASAAPRLAPAARVNEGVAAVLDLDRGAHPLVDSVLASSDTSADARSTVRQLNEQVRAQEQLLRAAKGARLPAVAVTSTYQRFSYPLSAGDVNWRNSFPNWTVGVGLSVPLFTGGRLRGDEMMAEANLVEARQRHDQVRELASLDARLAVAELEQQEAAYLASLGTDEVAARAYHIAEVRYNEGISTQVELAESRILLNQAAANRALAARNLQVARVKLALIKDLPLGGGQPASGSQQPQQPQQPQVQQRSPQGQSAPQGGAGGQQTQGQ